MRFEQALEALKQELTASVLMLLSFDFDATLDHICLRAARRHAICASLSVCAAEQSISHFLRHPAVADRRLVSSGQGIDFIRTYQIGPTLLKTKEQEIGMSISRDQSVTNDGSLV